MNETIKEVEALIIKNMTQNQFNEIVNIAATLAAEDMTNDFYTILEEMIEDYER